MECDGPQSTDFESLHHQVDHLHLNEIDSSKSIDAAIDHAVAESEVAVIKMVLMAHFQ